MQTVACSGFMPAGRPSLAAYLKAGAEARPTRTIFIEKPAATPNGPLRANRYENQVSESAGFKARTG